MPKVESPPFAPFAAEVWEVVAAASVNDTVLPALAALIKEIGPKLVVNLALPYQDLTIMDACLIAGAHYMDTANYEPKDVAKFEYHWQWAYQERFKDSAVDRNNLKPGDLLVELDSSQILD